jgi:hypothetical protein
MGQEDPDPGILVVQFLLPVYDRAGRPYPPEVHLRLQHDLERLFDGWSIASERPLEGAWRNPASGEVEYDASWRYEIGIAAARLVELDDFLAELAHRLGQKALWRVAYLGGEGRIIAARPPSQE